MITQQCVRVSGLAFEFLLKVINKKVKVIDLFQVKQFFEKS